tara:strand:+ start:2624 stop:3079 length:456 start_codon:yes stop_codon:yes gene_type:complete
MSVLSLYIPIISENITETFITKVFSDKNIGKILRVDFVHNNVKNRREAFIHFDEWFNSNESSSLKEDILNPDTKTQFVYGVSNKFWPLLVNKNAHKRNNNPNYTVLKSDDIKTDFKVSLNIETNKSFNPLKSDKSKKTKKEEKTYASVITA